MDISQSVVIKATANQVFGLYCAPNSWPKWDSEVVAVQLSRLEVDATGWLKPLQGPRAAIRVVEVVQDKSFTIESKLPLCVMRFGHALTEEAGATTARHWVSFTGPLAFVFRRLIGRGIARTLPQTLAGLKRAAEDLAGQ